MHVIGRENGSRVLDYNSLGWGKPCAASNMFLNSKGIGYFVDCLPRLSPMVFCLLFFLTQHFPALVSHGREKVSASQSRPCRFWKP